MTALVTMEDVNFRLRLDLETDSEGEFVDERTDGIESLIEDATGIVLDYLKVDGTQWAIDGVDGEEPAPVPAPINAAIIRVVRNLYDEEEEPLSEPVKAMLHRFRDPALA